MMLSKYFSRSELQCKCGCNAYSMDSNHLYALDLLREELGVLNVTSGFRCMNHNKYVGGVDNSFHTRGRATDVVPKNNTLSEVSGKAKKYFEEVIEYDTFVHVGNAFPDLKLKAVEKIIRGFY